MHEPSAPARPSLTAWIWDNAYLLLSLASLFWAGNIVLGRVAAGQIPPMTLTFIRWGCAFLLLLPFSWDHIRRDWPMIRHNFGFLLLLGVCGLGGYNAIAYMGLQFTQALNAALMQSAGPLFVALWAMILFRTALSPGQTIGILTSLVGVIVIVTRGNLSALATVDLNKGDILLLTALVLFALYSALAARKPSIHPLSFLTVTIGLAAVSLIPLAAWEWSQGHVSQINPVTIAIMVYVATMPSIAAYLFFNRGVQLIGPNRASPFFHLMPVFASGLAMVFLGEKPALYHAIGYALVLTGIFIATRRASAIRK